MNRRDTIVGLLALGAVPLSANAQRSGRIARVGVLTSTFQATSPRGSALVAGLRDLGYVDGQNVVLEWRMTEGRAERLPALVAELVSADVDVIVANDNPAIFAAQKATKKIPIVMVLATDPVGTGFVASLARPGGNVTGLTVLAADLQVKMLQILKETLPHVSRIAVLWNPSEPERRALASEAERAAGALALQVRLMGVANPAELDPVFTAMHRERVDAVLIQPSQTNFSQRARIAALAAQHRLPTMGWSADTVEAGWLMSYGPSIIALFRRAGYFVDRILKGARPADLPIEQPTKFELVINLKTAKALRLAIPRSVLLRADQVIE